MGGETDDFGDELERLRDEVAELRDRLALMTPAAGFEGGAITPTALETVLALSLVSPEPFAQTAEAPPDVLALLATNLRPLRALEQLAVRREALGDHLAVLNLARAAADWSWTHHPGLYVSGEFERLVQRSGAALTQGVRASGPRSLGRRRVMHVLTVAREIGGHTRLAERWIRFDRESDSSVVLTEQIGYPVPEALSLAVGGRVFLLEGADPGARVVELLSLMSAHDLMVLHTHPYDAVTVAACGARPRPPVVLCDHGDHQFWLGVGAADIVVSLRHSGQRIALERRGVDPARSAILPLPLDLPRRRRSREEAQRALGLPHGAVIMMTMASEMKYAPVPPADFISAMHFILDASPGAHLMAIGPSPDRNVWRDLRAHYPGRVHVPGPATETGLYLEAADVYVDSFPFSSLTSLLEAALYETPVVSLRLPGCGPMGLDDPTFDLPTESSLDEWSRRLIEYVADSTLRRVEGQRLARLVANGHGEARWSGELVALYAAIPEVTRTTPDRQMPKADDVDGYLACYLAGAGIARSASSLLAAYGLLPAALA